MTKLVCAISKDKTKKIVKSDDYNYIFSLQNGFFMRWGKTTNDDPDFAPAPELLDIEVTTKCSGISSRGPCSFCYKSNTPNGKNMSFDTFKTILDKFPNILTQVAFGADSHCTSNPDIWKMMEYAREKSIIPNITVAEIDDNTADKLATHCGAVAVSFYGDKDICYNSVKRLTDRNLSQVNIHVMLSKETLQNVYTIMKDYKSDERLNNLKSIIILGLKQKGRGNSHTLSSNDDFKQIVDYSIKNNISIGFDSCSAHKYMNVIQNYPDLKESAKLYVEPCESTCFSSYINVDGDFYPCSFCENIPGWEHGIHVPSVNNFIKDVWNNPKTIEFRNNLLKNNRHCPIYTI